MRSRGRLRSDCWRESAGWISGGASERGALRRAAARGLLVADDVLPPHLRIRDSVAGHDAVGAERRYAIDTATALFWLLQLGMMFDVPGLSRRAGLAGTPLFANVLYHVDRALIIVLFVGLVALPGAKPRKPLGRRICGRDLEGRHSTKDRETVR